ncbi:peptidylprolyl isomerase [Alteromonas sediminis]|uniref:peptidylprolyl isomerase n=1 Tax=Alteromonas sediminis TaxID=2259342 RepID=A0A3N5XZZ5_9ALTE|nr:peptidylprolyl isomerase [Alteromonas sediminis]RPJ65676.1 peptidylprolyl isomerase [Alteromonas sediminis]
MKSKLENVGLALLALFVSAQINATEVQIRTNLGNFNVNLFDTRTPVTVDNFLAYANAGAYAQTIVHRSEPGFVIQSGGFVFSDTAGFEEIPTGNAIANEPELSNVRGTIAMAKLPSDENSATSQWFINLDDNSANLDVQNGGFTVFGQVIGEGMDVVDAIASLPRFSTGSFSALPLRDYTASDASNNVTITRENMVIIEDIVIVNDAQVTNPDITPVANTRIDQLPTTPDTGSSGGAVWYLLAPLFMLAVRRALKRL